MATKRQLQTIRAIQLGRQTAKKNGEKVSERLSLNEPGYEKAIRSVMNAGAFSVGISLLSLILLAVAYVINLIPEIGFHFETNTLNTYITVASCVVSVLLGYKLYELDVTPIFALISLIVMLLFNLASIGSILPAIAVVLIIVALSRWMTFKDWFEQILKTKKH